MLTQSKIDQLASKHGVSTAAVKELAETIARGRGSLAQFSHPDRAVDEKWDADDRRHVQ